MPRIAVVVTAFNAARFLEATLDSVVGQSFSDWQLLVVDDESTDSTPAVVRRYSSSDARIAYVHLAHGGIAASRNRGLACISLDAPYVMFLDHDDVLDPKALETLLAELETDLDASAAYGLARYIDECGNLIRKGELEWAQRSRRACLGGQIVDWPVEAPTTFDVAVFWSFITTPGQVLVRRAHLPADPPFDARVAPADDWDLWFRLALTGPIRLVDRLVLNYRLHDRNTSRNEALMDKACIRARRKFYSMSSLTDEQRERVVYCYHFVERVKYQKYRAEMWNALRRGEARIAVARGVSALRSLYRSARTCP
jgi:glycosyltransferase involved in cell wall biosynthesis